MLNNEKYLIQECIKGNRNAQEVVYKKFSGKMLAICKRYIKDQSLAEDAFQEAFIKSFNNLSKFSFKSSLETWLTRIFINESINMLRANRKLQLQVRLDEMNYDLPELEDSNKEEYDSELILMLLEKIPENYATVLMLFAIDGFNHKEISEKLNISEKNSRSILSRARASLNELLINEKDQKINYFPFRKTS